MYEFTPKSFPSFCDRFAQRMSAMDRRYLERHGFVINGHNSDSPGMHVVLSERSSLQFEGPCPGTYMLAFASDPDGVTRIVGEIEYAISHKRGDALVPEGTPIPISVLDCRLMPAAQELARRYPPNE